LERSSGIVENAAANWKGKVLAIEDAIEGNYNGSCIKRERTAKVSIVERNAETEQLYRLLEGHKDLKIEHGKTDSKIKDVASKPNYSKITIKVAANISEIEIMQLRKCGEDLNKYEICLNDDKGMLSMTVWKEVAENTAANWKGKVLEIENTIVGKDDGRCLRFGQTPKVSIMEKKFRN